MMDAPAHLPQVEQQAPQRALARSVTSRPRLAADRAARWLVTGGGLAIITAILGILLFILIEVWPLTTGARVSTARRVALPEASSGVMVTDEHRTHVALLSPDGMVRILETSGGKLVDQRALLEGGAALIEIEAFPDQQLLAASAADGKIHAVPVSWDVSFAGPDRVITPGIGDPIVFELDPRGEPVRPFSVRVDSAGAAVAAGQLADGSLVVLRRSVEQNLFTGESREAWDRQLGGVAPALDRLVLDGEQRTLYGATSAGELLWWELDARGPGRPNRVTETGEPITALGLLVGDRSLVVGRSDGSLEIWFKVRQPDESFRLTRIRQFPSSDHSTELILDADPWAIRRIAASTRGKSFLALDESGNLGLYHSTSRRVLWRGQVGLSGKSALLYAPKGDGAFLAEAGQLAAVEIDNPHPEVSFGALFCRVWYESYPEPAYVWQSSSGSDDFEPKLSLIPLIVGTLKGTLYSLVLAIPLGVLGAMYTSQFMRPGLKRTVKPIVEVMAALPSVVLGFLAGLWLAPRVERVFSGLLLLPVLLPLLVLAAWAVLRRLPRSVRARLDTGREILPYMVVLALGIWVSLALSGTLERLVFGGSFPAWLLSATGLRYDQRNAIVVGLAMGFAVIPVIFSIAEEAFSNVPRTLVSGSLALGANRWQTVTRVVLPAASPGIFSAIMIGFGRAVGETMIVLMATGNTPLLDWNPFNGFRTLSANIAVEIPEAPHGGTLYRTLFLAALILFAFTFAVNTVAELIRQRLRQRYSES